MLDKPGNLVARQAPYEALILVHDVVTDQVSASVTMAQLKAFDLTLIRWVVASRSEIKAR